MKPLIILGWVGVAVKFKGRLFLRNGYHRVYEIRKGAVTHVPCILIGGENFAVAP